MSDLVFTGDTCSFVVYGKPQQRGSKNPMHLRNKQGKLVTRPGTDNPMIVVPDDNVKSKDWVAAVSAAAGETWKGNGLMIGPLLLEAVFYFARPQDHYGTGKNEGKVKPSAPRFHAKQPDLSKLVRSIEDAMTGVVYRDDRQIAVYGDVRKEWTEGSAHALIAVGPFT